MRRAIQRDPDRRTVTIPSDEYFELLDAQRELACLNAAGVDNWEGYEFAMGDFYGSNEDVL